MTTHNVSRTGTVLLAAVSLTVAMASSGAIAQDKVHGQVRMQPANPEHIYGSRLMTRAERIAHRAKLRQLKTEQERDAYRLEHHKLMQERAQAKGLTLPDEAPMRGAGMGADGPGSKKP
jgi:predicted secreted protein